MSIDLPLPSFPLFAVGCEADAVAFTEEAQATDGGLCAVAPDGGYVAGETPTLEIKIQASKGCKMRTRCGRFGPESLTLQRRGCGGQPAWLGRDP
eukprot:scaffold96144_cov17-Tisochrysis_lutea.AAC.3